jgi:hypothetical protein
MECDYMSAQQPEAELIKEGLQRTRVKLERRLQTNEQEHKRLTARLALMDGVQEHSRPTTGEQV